MKRSVLPCWKLSILYKPAFQRLAAAIVSVCFFAAAVSVPAVAIEAQGIQMWIRIAPDRQKQSSVMFGASMLHESSVWLTHPCLKEVDKFPSGTGRDRLTSLFGR